MAWLLVATCHIPHQSKTDATCTCQGLGNDMETSLWLQSWSLGRGLVLALWQRNARACLHTQP